MSYTISEIKDELAGTLHGTTVNKITNLAGAMNRTARQLLLDCNPIETKRIAQLGLVFNSVYDYAAPADLKGVHVIDIRPQAGRFSNEQYEQTFTRWFDANKRNNWNNAFNINHNAGVKSLRIEAPVMPAPLAVTGTGETTGWAVGGTATNLGVDTTHHVAGSGALSFDVAVGTGYIETTSLSDFDLTDHVNIASIYWWVYLPSVPTSVSVRLGSDTTANYYTFSATAQADGTALKAGWNIIGVSWVGLTATGSPAVTDYDSVRFSVVATTSMVGVKFCSLTSNIGKHLEMVYYSKYLFSNSGVWQEKILDTDSADLTTIVNLDTESYGLFFNLLLYYISQNLMGANAAKDGQFALMEYQRSLKKYTAMYKSETLLPSEPYYKIPR